MLRGINKQLIFEDEEDYDCFLEILRECKELCNFKIYAYCLMGNHVHLLIKAQENNLETIFKRIAGRYVYYYNVKYQRVGHLFQDRFKSEPVEDDAYLLTVLRYIHQNPVKAKLCKKVEEYCYSSIGEYLCNSEIVDGQFIHQFKCGIRLGAGVCHGVTLAKGFVSRASAKHIGAVGAQRVPIGHGKAQVLAHGLAADDLVGVVVAEGKGILGLGALVGDLFYGGEKFFHDGDLTFLW